MTNTCLYYVKIGFKCKSAPLTSRTNAGRIIYGHITQKCETRIAILALAFVLGVAWANSFTPTLNMEILYELEFSKRSISTFSFA